MKIAKTFLDVKDEQVTHCIL